MAMNYVGSISILDRGDAPAQAVIDRNARSLAQRIADETKDELEKVMTRVETIYSSFEDTDQVYGTSNLEYLQDITELEELMKDQVKKKKYQQQVTIFIVGFSDISGQKLRLLQQVNEFFTENSKEIDKEDWFPTTPDLDLEEVGDKIDDSLQTARDLSKRLGELNKEMVEYMANYAEKKASNKLTQLVEGKGKKKMEKALAQAREEVQTLAEKLMAAQTDLEEKDDKLQSTFKQLEMKNLEVQKFRTAAELAKKAVQDTEALQEEIAARDAKLLEQRQQLTRMEIELAQSNHVKERSQTKMSSMGEESQQKIIMLQKELDEQKKTADDAKRDLAKFHDEQLSALRGVHQQDMEEMKRQHAEQIQSLTSDLQRVTAELASTRNALLELQIEKGVSETQSEVGKHFDLDSEEGTSRNSSKQESRPSTKDKSGRPSGAKKQGAKSPTRSSGGKDAKGSKSSSGGASIASDDLDDEAVFDDLEVEIEPRAAGKEFTEVAIQDEGGDPASALYEENKIKTPGTRHSRRSKSTLAPVEEFEDFEDAYDLSDEQSWASVPKDQLQGRFAQYRRICQNKLREMEEQRQLTVAKTQRKVQLLKAQFVEHKNKWEAERKILIEQVEQAQQLQTDAEKEADQAMTQLEDFITEQEKLEEEEEVRRSAILRGTSSSSLSPANLTPGTKTPLPSSAPAAGATASSNTTPPDSRSTHNSEELQNLLQQTDDAKVEELRERLAGTKSAPPGVDTADAAADQDEEGAAEDGKEQASDMAENEARGPSAEAARQVALSELRDLPPIDGTAQDPSATTPSSHPPPTAATIGSLPAHDQLETPLAELAEQDAAKYAKGDKDVGQDGGELKDEASNLEKGRTDVTGDRQGTEVTEKSVSTMAVPEGGDGGGGTSEGTADSTNASRAVQPPSKTPDTVIKIDGDTEDELREASARSRASLRTHYKNQLEETRQAVEDRRSKTPVITLPSKLSVDDELVLDEDEEDEFDEEMALPDDLKEELEEQKRKLSMYEMGTSPPPGPGKDPSSHSVHLASRKAGTLVDHPLLEEYLKTYDGVASFKNTLSTLFLDKDMMSASQILADLETLVFDREKKVMPQVEQLTINALFILEEIASVISGAVMVDREPPVSSLLPYSRDEVRSRLPPTREASEDVYPAYTHPKMVTPASASGTDQVFVNNVSDGSGGAAGVKGDGVDATVFAEAKAAEVTGRVSAGSGGDAVEGGSQAGSLQGSRKSSVSGSTKQYLADLQAQCSVLQARLEEENKKHEEQLRHNTVVMMEMQDTINELQRELSALGKSSARKARSATSSALGLAKTPSPDQSLMFTRLDLERNAKIMKKAVMDQRLDADRYKEAVTTMDDYVSLPAQRLAHLVKKYVHHSRMKEIEENVKNSECLDEQVFDTLDKMEALQNQRARHWAEKMDMMGFERLRLAAMLMDSLDSIEQESGLFLIKPMYSYRGRELKAPPTQKLVRPVRTQPVQRHPSAAHESTTSFVPAPTPASNARRMERTHTPSHQPVVDLTAFPPPPPSRPEDGVVGAGVVRSSIGTPQAPQMVQSYQTWNMSASQARSPIDGSQHPLNTPRMLELDINRMLIGQNNVSTKLPHPPTDDRLVNASNNGLRSYVTVQRPTAALAGERPTSANAGGRDTGAPPSSPSPRPQVPVSPADRDLPDTMTSPPPLPPIGDRAASASSSNNDGPEPPQSPPGSSMYQSTMHDPEEGPMVKAVTRTSSQLTTSLLTDEEED